MIVYRLSKDKHKTDLTGTGASIKGGRWNGKGVYILYTAANRSLAMAEVAVHLSIASLPRDFYMIEIFIPDKSPVLKISEYELTNYWNSFKLNPFELKKIGNSFIEENKYLVIQVPSTVTKGDYNYLLNPEHELFREVKIINFENFPFDHRLFRQENSNMP